MNVRELKDAIADLPDDTPVLVGTAPKSMLLEEADFYVSTFKRIENGDGTENFIRKENGDVKGITLT
jgi:hypothetical protein